MCRLIRGIRRSGLIAPPFAGSRTQLAPGLLRRRGHELKTSGDTEVIAWSRLMQPRAEAEIAVVLARELSGHDIGLTEALPGD